MCTTDFIERGSGVGSAARIVEAQRLEHCLATIVISQIELTKRRRRVGDSANSHVSGVNIQPVRDVPSKHERIVILLLNATRDVQYEHYIHLLATTCNARYSMVHRTEPPTSKIQTVRRFRTRTGRAKCYIELAVTLLAIEVDIDSLC